MWPTRGTVVGFAPGGRVSMRVAVVGAGENNTALHEQVRAFVGADGGSAHRVEPS